MRKIVMTPGAHNRTGRALLGGAVATLLLTAACGDRAAERSEVAGGPTVLPCAVTVDDQALRAFYGVADRVAAGQTVTVEDLGDLAATPVLDRWRRSYAPEEIPAAWTGRMMYLALVGEDQLPERLKAKSRRADLMLAYEVTLEQRRHIEDFAAELASGDILCGIRDEIEPWLGPGVLPDTLRVELLASFAEIRLFEDRLLLDGGLAWASGREQLPRFLAAILYKELGEVAGKAPANVSGDAILLESLRLITNLVAPAMIERSDQIVFDKRHRLLGMSAPSPTVIADQAHRTLESLAPGLTRVRRLASTTDEDWLQLYRLFVGAQSWQATGWYLGQVIDQRLGRERLHQAVRHPADLIAAYQEAARSTDGSTTAEPHTMRWYFDTAPALADDDARWLEDRLRAYFQ